MPGLNINDLITCNIHGTLFGQQMITTFAYRITAASQAANTVDACTSWAGSWKAGAVSPFLSFLAACSPEYSADTVRVQRIYPTRNIYGQNVVGLIGTNANATDSTNQAASITRGAELSGRRYVGKIQIPGLAAGNMLAGNVTNAFLSLMSTIGSKMLNTFYDLTDGTTAGVPVLLHRIPGTQIYDNVQLYRTIPQRTARVMRRRTIGVGK